MQDRPVFLPLEDCPSLSLSRLCSCSYQTCKLCLLVCYQSSVPRHAATFRDNLFFPAWLIAVGRRTETKSSEKNTLKENGKKGNRYISAILHPPFLPNTSASQKNGFCSLLCLPVTHVSFCLLQLFGNLFEEKYAILYLLQPLLNYLLLLFSRTALISCPPNKPVLF